MITIKQNCSHKILILKNDRVGDLFHSLKGIYSIIESNLNNNKCDIEIVLSNYSKNMSFNNKKISIKEFKPGKVLPSKNEENSLLKFKQEFQKLIK